MKIRWLSIISLFLCFTLFAEFVSTNTFISYAGSVSVEKSSEDFKNGKINSDWYVTSDVESASNADTEASIVFPDKSTASSRAILQHRISDIIVGTETNYLEFEFNLTLNSVTDKFGVMLGLESANAKLGYANSSFIWFKIKDGKIYAGISAFDENKNEIAVKEETIIKTDMVSFDCLITAAVSGEYELKVDGNTVFSGTGLKITGFAGFGQSAKSYVKINTFDLKGFEYDRPSNANLTETFDYESYNANMLYSKSKTGYDTPSYLKVENGKLVFKNVSQGFLSSKYEYSNVDVSFDVDIDRENSFSEDGNRDKIVSSGFSVSLGSKYYKSAYQCSLCGYSYEGDSAKTSCPYCNGTGTFNFDPCDYEIKFCRDAGTFLNDAVTSYLEIYKRYEFQKSLHESIDLAGFNLFSEREMANETINVWIQMLDGELSVNLKTASSKSFVNVYCSQVGDTSLGHVKIHALGSQSKSGNSALCNMSIDNFSLTNFDVDGKSISAGYKTNIWHVEDFIYSDKEETAIKDQTGKYVQSKTWETEPVYSLSFNALGGEDVMPIGVWWGPYKYDYGSIDGNVFPDYHQDKYYKLFKDCGINMITVNRNNYVTVSQHKYILEALDLCQKYGMGMFVQDSALYTQKFSKGEKLLEWISSYITHPACIGIHCVDEPKQNVFDTVRNVFALYDSLGWTDKVLYVNLYGMGNAGENYSGVNGKSITYEEYLRSFVKKVNTIKFLSADTYPFNPPSVDENGNLTESVNIQYFYRYLNGLRTVSQENKIPFWGLVQAGDPMYKGGQAYSVENYYPQESTFLWEVNVMLCYGAKSITYFTGIQPEAGTYDFDDKRDFERMGLIGAAGNINRWYYYAKKANKQIASIDHILMNSTNLGFIPVGVEVNGLIPADSRLTSFREVKSCSSSINNLLVGCFDYRGKTALYVVNNSWTDNQTAELKFDDKYKYEITKNGSTYIATGDTLNLNLNAGEGAMVLLK